ncbi:MAG: hypothetical protein ABFS56_02740 [Pseudomonadota bacterium]
MIDSLTQKIDANHSKLKNIVKIGSGMQTGANEIFTFKEKAFPKAWLKKRISGKQIEKYAITEPTDYILYVEENFEQLPTSIQQYLLKHKTQLANRPAKKKRSHAKWWNYSFPTHKDYYHLDKNEYPENDF